MGATFIRGTTDSGSLWVVVLQARCGNHNATGRSWTQNEVIRSFSTKSVKKNPMNITQHWSDPQDSYCRRHTRKQQATILTDLAASCPKLLPSSFSVACLLGWSQSG